MTEDSPISSHPDTFGARTKLAVGDRSYEIFHIRAPALTGRYDVDRLPYSIKVLLENLLRHEDGAHVTADDIVAVASGREQLPEGHGQGAGEAAHEITFTPRTSAHAGLHRGARGGRPGRHARCPRPPRRPQPRRWNPLVPVELVIDHSVIIERSGAASAYDANVSIEYGRNLERYTLLRWAQGAFTDFSVVPPRHGHLPPGEPRVPLPSRLRH